MEVGILGHQHDRRVHRRSLLRAVYRTIRKDKAPTAVFDPDNRQFSWPDAAVWAVAGGLGLALAKIGSARHCDHRLEVRHWHSAATGRTANRELNAAQLAVVPSG